MSISQAVRRLQNYNNNQNLQFYKLNFQNIQNTEASSLVLHMEEPLCVELRSTYIFDHDAAYERKCV